MNIYLYRYIYIYIYIYTYTYIYTHTHTQVVGASGISSPSPNSSSSSSASPAPASSSSALRRALLAVTSTAAILRCSAILTTAGMSSDKALGILSILALLQWALLDGVFSSLLLAFVLAIGGPLAEIPFMAAGCWHYIAPDYWPLSALGLGANSGTPWAGLSALTGPCYFAVTTDSIALGRWLRLFLGGNNSPKEKNLGAKK